MPHHNKSNTVIFVTVFQVRGQGVDSRPVHIGFIVEKVAMG